MSNVRRKKEEVCLTVLVFSRERERAVVLGKF